MLPGALASLVVALVLQLHQKYNTFTKCTETIRDERQGSTAQPWPIVDF